MDRRSLALCIGLLAAVGAAAACAAAGAAGAGAGADAATGAGAYAGAALSAPQAQAREIYARLIAFRTSVGLGQVPAMADYLTREFRAAGFPAEDIRFLPLGETGSLVVRYRGDGSGGKPILLLSHMDVVTANRDDWQRDPFTLTEEHDFFYGRGTYDVKDGVACLTASFLRLKSAGFVPRRDLILLYTGDEEESEATTRAVLREQRALVDSEFALNTDAGVATLDEVTGRPLYFGIGTAEKTYASFELTTHNPGGHSSLPRPDNAIYELAAALGKLQRYAFPVAWNDTTLGYFRGAGPLTAGALGRAMQRFAARPGDRQAAALLSADPAYAGMLRTTCVPTLLRGGHAENALPQSATATVNCRVFPGVDPAAVRATLQRLAGPRVAVSLLGQPYWSDATPLRADVLAAVTRALHARHPGLPVFPVQESGASDAVFFRAIGMPTYGVHAAFIKPSDDYSHGLDERLPVQSFYDYLEFWYLLLTELAGPLSTR